MPDIFFNGRVSVHEGDSRDVLKTLADASIDSVVCDPPYALVSIVKRFGADGAAPAVQKEGGTGAYARASAGFMGQQWDTGETAFAVEFWAEVHRVLKPGGHLVAFSGSRTYHRLACAIEDSGFEIRDSIIDVVSSDASVTQFMDSLDEVQAMAFMNCVEDSQFGGMLAWMYGTGFPKSHNISKAIDKMNGRQFASSPASGVGFMGPDGPGGYNVTKSKLTLIGEQSEAAVAWRGWGTALKPAFEPICLARKPISAKNIARNVLDHGTGALNIDACRVGDVNGRFPANVIHDGSDEVVAAFPATNKGGENKAQDRPKNNIYGDLGPRPAHAGFHDFVSAARFYYSAKADKGDRVGSTHPTVKPVDLMRWLVRLITPEGGVVLDPFAGSGTTGEAAVIEGCNAVLIEREPKFAADIRRRMNLVFSGPDERSRESIKASGKAPAPDNLPLVKWSNENV